MNTTVLANRIGQKQTLDIEEGAARYFIFDGILIVLPATINAPLPR